MEITFDPAKDALNIKNHGVSLALAAELEWEWLRATPDTRLAYDELRMVGYAPIGSRVFCVVYTERDNATHIISLRKATREVNRYASEI